MDIQENHIHSLENVQEEENDGTRLIKKDETEITPNSFEVSRLLSKFYGIGTILFSVAIYTAVLKGFTGDRKSGLTTPVAYYYMSILFGLSILFMAATFINEYLLYRRNAAAIEKEIAPQSTNVYLKVGLVMFGIVAILFLLIGFMCYFDVPPKYRDAGESYFDMIGLVFHVLQIAYLLRYSRVCFQQKPVFIRFGVMHMIATNVTYWLQLVAFDTVIDFTEDYRNNSFFNFSPYSDGKNVSTLNKICSKTSGYMTACIIEYSIIAATLLQIIWGNVGQVRQPAVEITPVHKHSLKNALYGIATGSVFLVSVIIFGVLSVTLDDERVKHLVLPFSVFRIITFICMLVTVIVCLRSVHRNSCNALGAFPPITFSTNDCTLLLFCLSFFILDDLYSLLAVIVSKNGNALDIFNCVLGLIVFILQSVVIIIGLYDNSVILKRKMLIRQLLMFLFVVNISWWIFSHYELKHEMLFYVIEPSVYTELLWYIINHITTPVVILFAFHSSACIFEIVVSKTNGNDI
ncbi:proton channel OtopLc-like [Anneissia japonica]|uniref:proton channel OtopLc-like n=1 Tax=Anneissia japonica TaxID=1529436 RepID=UPI0014254F44|nr:proton channel OtopLc-like [Anneissia japonica]XP_033121234.1 proton channel OtopLc-like [Anneissia japonica]